jgi:purine nucleoside permease
VIKDIISRMLKLFAQLAILRFHIVMSATYQEQNAPNVKLAIILELISNAFKTYVKHLILTSQASAQNANQEPI